MKNVRITSIIINNTSSGLCEANEIIAETLKIYRRGEIIHLRYNGLSDKPLREYKYKIEDNLMDKFFDDLADKFNIESWDDDYSVDVCDGWGWECVVRYSNNKIKKIIGTVVAPLEALQLKKDIYELTRFRVEPWIF